MNVLAVRNRKVKSLSIGIFLIATLLGSCGSSSGSDETPNSSIDVSETVTSDAPAIAQDPVAEGIASAQAELDKYSAEPAAFEAQGDPVTGDIASLKGGVAWYIPIAYQFAPVFALYEYGFQQAFGKLGMTVRTCDAAGDPTIGANCVNDAVSSGAKVIITGAITYEFAPNAFDAATAAGIPIIRHSSGYPSESGDTGPYKKGEAYAGYIGSKALSLVADWMIVDSKGTANVLAVRISDTDWTKGAMTNGAVAEFEKYCPNCVVNVVDSATAQTGERPSVVAGALAANPDTNYILPAYESTVEPSGALEGATSVGMQDKLKAGMATGTGPGLQRIVDGKFVYVNVLPNTYQEAWATTDQAVRLLMGNEPVKDPLVQLRVFTSENVQGIDISKEAFQKSTMFGPNTFEAVYEKLWGVK